MSEIVRLRERGQLTLPKGIRDRMHLDEGDYLEIRIDTPGLVMRPTRLVAHGSPEAAALDRTAEEEIAAGRFRTFESADSLMDSLGWGSEPSEVKDVAEEPAVYGERVVYGEGASKHGEIARLAEVLCEHAGGGAPEALELWKAVGRALAERVEEEEEVHVTAGEV